MRSRAYGIMLAVLAAVPAWSDPSQLARDAAAALDRAAASLSAAETGRNRIAVLTETIRAYETGLLGEKEIATHAFQRWAASDIPANTSRSGS